MFDILFRSDIGSTDGHLCPLAAQLLCDLLQRIAIASDEDQRCSPACSRARGGKAVTASSASKDDNLLFERLETDGHGQNLLSSAFLNDDPVQQRWYRAEPIATRLLKKFFRT